MLIQKADEAGGIEDPHTRAFRGRLAHCLFASDRIRGLERFEPPAMLKRRYAARRERCFFPMLVEASAYSITLGLRP